MNVKIGQVNKLTGKENFTVEDLVKILMTLNPNANVEFGYITERGTTFCQEENFFFRLTYRSREDEWDENYCVQILTKTML